MSGLASTIPAETVEFGGPHKADTLWMGQAAVAFVRDFSPVGDLSK
jgi:hypothetical protein